MNDEDNSAPPASPQWSAVKRELVRILELPAEERGAAIAQLHETDRELAAELSSFHLAEPESDFLEAPALRFFAAPGERSGDGPAIDAPGVDNGREAPGGARVPERIGPWHVEEEIGRGGMGTVYRARRDDGAFEQTVAVKLVRPELSSEMLRRRFLSERRILASLEHPNIARVLDGGTTAEGVPYLVLEYVTGKPVDVYADERWLTIEERLRLFSRVCAAVQHAHQKLVLHRDIKTANVLVDASGEPKLLDFGIAKILAPESAERSDEDLTSLGLARPLTPEWSSPEQLRGESLTTASDIYSLGVLLFVLLSGQRPNRYGGESAEAFAAAIEAAPLPTLHSGSAAPGVERRRLRGDLDRIVRKALDADPKRRYATASELAADVGRFLSGLPVEAHPDALGYRLRKLLGRHRAAAATALLVAASLVAATLFSLHQAQIAERERARAQRRFDDVRRLANVVLFDAQDALVNVSGAIVGRRLLVENALRYLDDLAREAGDEPDLLDELASAYERIGELQGVPDWPGEGHMADGEKNFSRALALRRRAAQVRAPEVSPAAAAAEAMLLTRIGSTFAARGDMDAALENHRGAAAIFAAEVRRAPTVANYQALAVAQVAVGDDNWEAGDLAGAEQSYAAALASARAGRETDKRTSVGARQVGVIEQRLGDLAAERADWKSAGEHHRASLAVDEELLRLEPENAELRRDLGTDLSRIGSDALGAGDAAVALAAHLRARELRESLLAAEPADTRAQDDAAESALQSGRAFFALGRVEEGLAASRVAVTRYRRLAATDPENVHWQASCADALSVLAPWEARSGATARARALLDEAVRILEALETRHPDLRETAEALAEARRLRGELDPLPARATASAG
ncbi:MAG: serine/threonine-protein kinase [Thermoanaerobaculia bacterium]